jgi:hypothetical protein
MQGRLRALLTKALAGSALTSRVIMGRATQFSLYDSPRPYARDQNASAAVLCIGENR